MHSTESQSGSPERTGEALGVDTPIDARTDVIVERRRLRFGFDRFSGLYLWLVFIVAFSIDVPDLFPTWSTVHAVAADNSIQCILALAVLFPLAAGAFDLTVGAVANFSAIFVTLLQTTYHLNMWLSILITFLISLAIGVINGFIVVVLRISSFIATLGMGSIIVAAQTICAGSAQPLAVTTPGWLNLTQANFGGFQVIVFYVVVIGLAAWWALEHTPPGRFLYAIGGGEDAARLSGVRVGKWIWLALIASAGLSGITGMLYASFYGPSLTFGPSLLLPAFAAAFLGGTQFKPGKYNVFGSILAVYVLATGVRGFSYISSAQWLNDMFNGVALIVAVGFAIWRQRTASLSQRR